MARPEKGFVMTAQAQVSRDVEGLWFEGSSRYVGEADPKELRFRLFLTGDGEQFGLALYLGDPAIEDLQPLGVLMLGVDEADAMAVAMLAKVLSGEDAVAEDMTHIAEVGLRMPANALDYRGELVKV